MEEDIGDGAGMLMRPDRHRLLVSKDKQSVILMFDDQDQKRVSIALQRSAAIALRDQLCGILGIPEPADGSTKHTGLAN